MPKLPYTPTRATVRASNLLVDMRELRAEVLVEHQLAGGLHQERRDWERLGQLLDTLVVALQDKCGARDELGEVDVQRYVVEAQRDG